MKRCGSDSSRRNEEQSPPPRRELINRARIVKMVVASCLPVTCCFLHAEPGTESVPLVTRHSPSSIRIYQLPQGEVAASLAITADGLPLPVSQCYVSAYPYNRRWPGHQRTTDQREVAYFARLAGNGPITFRYTPARAFSVCTVRPLSAKVTPTVKDGTITFTLPRAGGYSVGSHEDRANSPRIVLAVFARGGDALLET